MRHTTARLLCELCLCPVSGFEFVNYPASKGIVHILIIPQNCRERIEFCLFVKNCLTQRKKCGTMFLGEKGIFTVAKTKVIRVRVAPELEEKIETVKVAAMRDDNSDTIRFLLNLGYQFWQQRQPHVMGQAQQGG